MQKNLLLSILPAHIASAIELDIRKMILDIRNEKRKLTRITPNGSRYAYIKYLKMITIKNVICFSVDSIQPVPRSFHGQTIRSFAQIHLTQ